MRAGVLSLAAALVAGCACAATSHRLWYGQPAEDSLEGWERQSLPLGCGHFGVNVFGDARHERLQVTHNAVLTGRPGSEVAGNLTSALDLRIDFDCKSVDGYERGLDLEKGFAWVRFKSWGNLIRREYFTSYPARAMAMRFTASEKGGLTFRVRPEIPYLAPFASEGGKGFLGRRGTVVAKGGAIAVDQELERYGVKFAGRILVVPEGGTMTSDAASVVVSNAHAAVVYFACDTNYRLSPHTFAAPRGEKLDAKDDPGPRADRLVAAARAKGWNALRAEHERDLDGLLGRAAIDLGADEADARIPTDGLRRAYEQGRHSRYLEETYWQYGRYLLVASSRPGTLPANLQGVWSAHQVSPWGCGYWHNINVQMNYWPAFNSNLAECFQAYADFNAAFRPTTRGLAVKYLKDHGLGPLPADGEAKDMWCVGTAVWPYVVEGGPGGHSGPGTGGLTTKVFADWYDFTLDRKALETYVWPTVHGMADFLTRCVAETNGLYLSAFSASPEQMAGKLEDGWWSRPHTGPTPYYTTVGCAFDQQMIWENNHDLLRFAEILGKDDAVVRLVREQIGKYDPVQVGASGQVKEFREENAYGEIGQLHHRHISQLVGLMPGTLITRKTPAWMAAARKTLDFRGDESTGWALAHRLNARARTGEGDRAYRLLNNLLSQRTFANLWDAHPPFQIDGNFGATAGITEMLVQSHADGIDLLPALPKAWAKKGSFRGLCARGAFEVDCEWRDGVPVKVAVRSLKGRPKPEIRFNGKPFVAPGASAGAWYDAKCGIPPLNTNRTEVLRFFAENVYGVRPAFPGFKPKYELVKTLDCGNCVRKEVRINTMTPLGETNFLAVAYFPKKSGKVPVWVMPGFNDETQDIRNFAAAHEGRVTRWPVDLIVSNGHATVMFMNRWVLDDRADVLDGVKRPDDGWGAIDAWALACSRCADWLETQPEADLSKLAVVGLSRLGKTALWAGATDTRFALVAPTCSGLLGARCTTVTVYGETIERITRVFPHWFAPQCRTRWNGKDRELPFDQHWLLAAVAPRLLAVGSATEDWWASPSGELAAFCQARNAWKEQGRCDYHVRRGGHNLLREDWQKYIEFAKKHGW